MNLNRLKDFRHEIYSCFGRAKDALFNTVDALLTEDRAQSFPELSLSPHFVRHWSSLYEGFEDGQIDHQRLRKVFASFLPEAHSGKELWIGIDVSGIARPRARTSADRSALYVHNLPECEKPITYGWQFSTVVALPEIASSWTYVLDQQRVNTETTAAQVAFAQLQQMVPLLPPNTVAVLDRGYEFDLVLVSMQHPATEGDPDPSQRQSVFLSCRSSSYRQARGTKARWSQTATRRSCHPW